MTIETATIAAAFANARKTGGCLTMYPGTKPTSLADGYAVQDTIVSLLGRTTAAWKVGRINGIQASQLGADRLAGPICDDHVFFVVPDERVSAPVYASGFVAAEAEFMMRIGSAPDPDKREYSLADAISIIDQVCVGIEIASSPFPGINDNGAAVTVSDLGNSQALIIGAALDVSVESDFENWPVTVSIDGQVVGAAMANTLPDGPYGAVRFLLENLAGRGILLKVGQWISTGAITGVHKIATGQHVVAQFGTRYAVECTTHAASPM